MPWQYWRMEELLVTYMLPFYLQNIAGSLTTRLLPPATRLHTRITCRNTGLSKSSEISEKKPSLVLKLFSTRFTTLLYLQHVYTCKNCSTANRLERSAGGRVYVMEIKQPYTVISPEKRGGGCNCEQGVMARQYGTGHTIDREILMSQLAWTTKINNHTNNVFLRRLAHVARAHSLCTVLFYILCTFSFAAANAHAKLVLCH